MLQEYQLGRVLGAGGFGLTYLGWDTALDKPVAIKEYLPNDLAVREANHSVVAKSGGDEDNFRWGLARFLDEARTLAKFKHPNIVSVYRHIEAHGTAYIVMEFVEGETFGAYLKRVGKPTEAYLRAMLIALLDGLAEVHRVGFMHRDIKPGNIIITVDGAPVLVDFGAARQEVGGRSRSITSVVTPGYAPIEQYSTRGKQGPWTDIYALGAVAYRAITGNAPPDATERVRGDDMTPATEAARGNYSAAFLAAVDWALAVDEDKRPQDVDAWRGALAGDARTEKLATGESAVEVETKPEVKRGSERKRTSGWAWAAAVAGVLIVGGLAVEWNIQRQEAKLARREAARVEAQREAEEQRAAAQLEELRRQKEQAEKELAAFEAREQAAAAEAKRKEAERKRAAAEERRLAEEARQRQLEEERQRATALAEQQRREEARKAEEKRVAAELEELRRQQEQAKKELAELEARKQREHEQAAAAEVKRKEEERKLLEAGEALQAVIAGLTPKCRTSTNEGDAPCWMEVDNLSGCYLWNGNSLGHDSVEWSGQCKNGMASGHGEAVFHAFFDDWASITGTGSFVNGKQHGKWVERSLVDVSEGSYVNGNRHGKWVMRSGDNVEESTYVNGKLHGKWIERSGDGAFVEGQYLNDQRHGRWVYWLSDDDVLFAECYENDYVIDEDC